MINFFEDPEPFDTHKTIESLKNAISLAKELDYTMADDGMEIGRSKDFITKVRFFPLPSFLPSFLPPPLALLCD